MQHIQHLKKEATTQRSDCKANVWNHYQCQLLTFLFKFTTHYSMYIKSLPPLPQETDTIPLAVIVLFKALCICNHIYTITLIGSLFVFVFLVFQGVFPILSLDAISNFVFL